LRLGDDGEPNGNAVTQLLERGEADGRLVLSEIERAAEELDLAQEELEQLYAELDERAVEVTDDSGRDGTGPPSSVNGDVASATDRRVASSS
jgi:Sigma-70 factor, region 1.1